MIGGTPLGGDCFSTNCEDYAQGACCFGDTCEIRMRFVCENQGGMFEGADTTCDVNPCAPLETGACCLPDGTCEETEDWWCTDTLGGEFQGGGVNCQGGPCEDKSPPSSNIYVYNGGEWFYIHSTKDVNSGNVASYGLLMAELGLLDANGRMPVPGDDNLLRHGDTVVGRILECPSADGGMIWCGYENADGTKRAYDISSGKKFRNAWEDVSQQGTITICKHGMVDKDLAGNVTQRGGALSLDDGEYYDGFRRDDDPNNGGTENLGKGPYPLPSRPNALIHVELLVCYGANDYDGPAPGISVLETLESIPGVHSASGETDKVRIKRRVSFLNSPTSAQENAFWRAVEGLATERGFRTPDGKPDHWGFLKSCSFESMILVLDWAAELSGVEYLSSFMTVDDPKHSVRISNLNMPVIDANGGLLVLEENESDETGTLLAQLLIPPNGLTEQTPIELTTEAIDVSSIPEGLEPVSAPISVRRYGVDTSIEFKSPAELLLEYPAFGPVPSGLFRVQPDGSLAVVADAWIDTSVHMVGTDVTGNGTYVILGEEAEHRSADFNFDHRVDILDLLEIINYWGTCTTPWCQHDLDESGDIAVLDLLILLDQWGSEFPI